MFIDVFNLTLNYVLDIVVSTTHPGLADKWISSHM